MAVERGAKSWRMAVSPTEDFTHVVVDSEQWGMGKIITREQFRNILGVDSSTPGLIKAGTESAPVVLEPREQPGLYIAKGSPGYYSWDGIVEEAQTGFDWYLVWNDDSESWSLFDMGELPDNAAKAKDWQAEEEYDRNTIVTHNDLQWIALVDTDEEPTEESESWEKFSPTPLKNEWDIETQMGLSGEGIGKGIVNNFQGGQNKVASAEDAKELDRRVNFLDRPDLKGQHFIIDADGNVIDRLLGDKHDGPRMWPEGMSVRTIDRPDLGDVIMVDKNGRLLSSENSGTTPGPGPEPSPEGVQYNIPVWNPPTQQGFNIPAAGDNTIIGNYDTLISAYDALLADGNINPNIPDYITKDIVGASKVGEIPIYRYKLKPANPKVKMLLIGGTHANEKMYVYCMYEMYKAIVNDWESHPFLDFLRWNAEIDFLPSRSPYTLANDVRKRGFRVIPETPPIPVTWTRSGNTVTLTFDVEDFPSDDFLSGSDYFTAMPATALEGKTSLGVITSDDENAVPLDAYKIASVVSGNSVSIEVSGATGATEGTGSIQVWTDPNRNWQNDGSNYWEGFVGSTTIQPNDAGNVIGFFDNKGTQPLSLKENRDFLELVLTEEYDFIIDGHAPASDNDWRFDRTTGNNPDLPLVRSETGAFNASTFNLLDRTGTDTAYTQNVLTVSYDQIFHTIEWGSGLYNADATQVRDALRWLGIVIKDTVNNKLKA